MWLLKYSSTVGLVTSQALSGSDEKLPTPHCYWDESLGICRTESVHSTSSEDGCRNSLFISQTKESLMAAVKPRSVMVISVLVWKDSLCCWLFMQPCVYKHTAQTFSLQPTSFRAVNGKFFKVPFYLKALVNFAAEILLDIQFSASNTNLNDINRLHKFGN